MRTNLLRNFKDSEQPTLPKDSIYDPVRGMVEESLKQEWVEATTMPAREWAKSTVQDLLRKNPRPVIWRGESVWIAWIATMMPFGWFDGVVKKMTKLDIVEQAVRKLRA